MKRASLGKAEWETLRYVVEHHPVTVREVADHAAETQGLARTTILTVMERLRRKRYLTRRKVAGVYQYAPRIPLSDILHGLIAQFVDDTLQGVTSPFFAYLSKSGNVSDQELDELRQLVSDLENQRKGPRP
jgi:predicted transcriptional regulator